MEKEKVIDLINEKIDNLEFEINRKWNYNLNNGCMIGAREELYAKRILLELRKEIEDE